MKPRQKMAFFTTPAGFEHPPLAPSKTLISHGRCAKSGAQCARKPVSHPDVAEIVAVWPDLPGHIKAAIQALIETSRETGKTGSNNE